MKYQILQGNNRETLRTLADNSIDAIVTDPPYGIDFLGKDWDANTGALETYTECLRVLKPGGHIVAFSAARTYHHLAITLEQAGFEIRDQIMWIYSSGFPKSQDIGRSIQRSLGVKERKAHKNNLPRVGGGEDKTKAWDESADQGQVVVTDSDAKQWEGWGTQLKPAHEPIALARKPIKLSIARNCQTHGVGALNIDATRIAYDNRPTAGNRTASFHTATGGGETQSGGDGSGGWEASEIGRFPSNVIGEIEAPYQKYFYCPKVNRKERHIGFNATESLSELLESVGGYLITRDGKKTTSWTEGEPFIPSVGRFKCHGVRHEVDKIRALNKITTTVGNNHPTVKPIELMKYLIRLITPAGGTVLDPFSGSGSTGCAAVELGLEYIGCELDPAYVDIARTRIDAWYAHTHPLQATGLFE